MACNDIAFGAAHCVTQRSDFSRAACALRTPHVVTVHT